MAFNGSGVFVRLYNWVNDAAANIKIRADRMDAEMDGMATGLSTCITKDGQTTITADIPFSGRKITGYGSSSTPNARTDVPSMGQVQDGKIHWVAAGGTADAITATLAPAVTTLVDGQLVFVRAGAANATTTPTLQVNSTTARTIVKLGGQALVAGDIYGAGHELVFRYNLSNTRYELLNPSVATALLGVTSGGTGRATSTTAYGLLAAGTTATGAHQTLAAGATTEILVGGGASALPVWTSASGTGAPVRASGPTLTDGSVTVTAPTTAAHIGYLGAPQSLALDSGDVTLALTDMGKSIDKTAANTRTLTIPANASVAFPVGTIIIGTNVGTGAITLAITTDTLRWESSTGSRTLSQYSSWAIKKITSTVWMLTGNGIT